MIVSYYTEGTKYSDVMFNYLLPSINKFDLEYDIQAVANFGTWKQNTDFKPRFILDMMEKYPNEDIIWLDADAEIVKYPELLFNIPKEYDCAVFYLDWNTHYGHSNGKKELVSSVAVFRPESKKFIKEWYLNAGKYSWEQKALEKALESCNKIYKLPPEYCCIVKRDNSIPSYIKNPIIIQHQKSRELKRNLI